MLETAKPILKDKIQKILYDALYEAQISTFSPNSGEANVNNFMKNIIDEASKKYADTASKLAAPELADAIYDFVKAIGITAIVKGTLANTGGPVTGTISPTDFQIN